MKLVTTLPIPSAIKAQIKAAPEERFLASPAFTRAMRPVLQAPLSKAAMVVINIIPPQVRRINLIKIMYAGGVLFPALLGRLVDQSVGVQTGTCRAPSPVLPPNAARLVRQICFRGSQGSVPL